jgi:hypothetical protein
VLEKTCAILSEQTTERTKLSISYLIIGHIDTVGHAKEAKLGRERSTHSVCAHIESTLCGSDAFVKLNREKPYFSWDCSNQLII